MKRIQRIFAETILFGLFMVEYEVVRERPGNADFTERSQSYTETILCWSFDARNVVTMPRLGMRIPYHPWSVV